MPPTFVCSCFFRIIAKTGDTSNVVIEPNAKRISVTLGARDIMRFGVSAKADVIENRKTYNKECITLLHS